jgi:hypothetical protein
MEATNCKLVGHLDIPGGGQVVVQGKQAFIGHMKWPHGTSIVDISELKHPRLVSTIETPEGTHRHKVRVRDDIMMVNVERLGRGVQSFQGGLKIYDISKPEKPREIAFFKTGGKGVHRFTIDERYAYISTELDGYRGGFTMIVDVKDPKRPEEVGRWWLPGQWIAGGETPTWRGSSYHTHHPMRQGDRLYVSLKYGGLAILDISDLSQPKMIGRLNWLESYQNSAHTTLPLPFKIRNRNWLVVVEEDSTDEIYEDPSAGVWMVDITAEHQPVTVETFHVPDGDFTKFKRRFGAHQPAEQVKGTVIPVTWFCAGLRFVDISDPYKLNEVGHFIPDPCGGQNVPQSNDVFIDDQGLIYLIDRYNGLDILEFTGSWS